jgi:UDP:flavonoid glycosyltransferase YjiC (YdhE family)
MNQLSFDISLQLEDMLISPKARVAGAQRGFELPERNVLLTGAWERAAMHVEAVSPWLTGDVPISRFRERRTGFLPVPSGAFRPIPEEVLEARAAGKRLVYFGMGSLALAGTSRIARHLEEEVRMRDGVLLLDRPAGKLLSRDDAAAIDTSGVAHDELFKLVDAAIVAGGTGTISTALRAGTPLIVLPHWFDQFAWCHLLQQRGLAAPGTPPSGRWSRKIAAGLDWAFEGETKQRASDAAGVVTGEDGVAGGAEALLELV